MRISNCTLASLRATSLIIGLSLAQLACAPDESVAPEATGRTAAVHSARQIGVSSITIIPEPESNADTVWGRATAINEAGVVAGWRANSLGTGNYAFTWKDGVMASLGTFFEPVAINRSGELAGNAGDQAVFWKDGVLTPLGTLGGTRSIATDMNDKGQIVGYIQFGQSGPTSAFIWQDGVATRLGTLGGPESVAEAINNHGQVAGYSRMPDGMTMHAFLWDRGVMRDIGTLGGQWSQAFAINDRGEIAGFSGVLLPGGLELSHRPFIWRRGVMTRLPLEGDADVDVFEINDLSDAGHLVGARNFSRPFIEWRAFVWHDGVVIDLPADGVSHAMSVNSSGEIAGFTGSAVQTGGAYVWTVGRHGP